MDMMQTAPQTALPALVSALPAFLTALISMLMINHAQLIQSAQAREAPLAREVSATARVRETALLIVVMSSVSMVTAATGSALLRKQIVKQRAGAKTECVKVPRIIALINAPPTTVMRFAVFVTAITKQTVQRIAAK